MGKITGLEAVQDVPEKVRLLYRAVEQLIAEGADVNNIRVLTITEKAGIGKGTAYDYFESREELIACALVFYIRKNAEEITAELLKKASFTEQIELILDEIEQKNQNQQWFFHFVHIMTDNNEISRIVRDKILLNKKNALSQNIFGEIIRKNKERGDIRKDVPDHYLFCSLFSRFMTYMISVSMEDFFPVSRSEMRSLVFQEIMYQFSLPCRSIK